MDRCLGRPLPHQPANPTRAPPKAINLSPFPGSYGISRSFPLLSRTSGQVPTRYSPVRHSHPKVCVRLACVKRAASVRSEPGSNSQIHHPTDSHPSGSIQDRPGIIYWPQAVIHLSSTHPKACHTNADYPRSQKRCTKRHHAACTSLHNSYLSKNHASRR